MQLRTTRPALGLLLLMLTPAAAQPQARSDAAIDPKADAILRKMSEKLAAAESFSFVAHDMADESLASGRKLQLGNTRRVLVQRPNKVHIDLDGDLDSEIVIYDGAHLTVLNRKQNVYSVVDTPDTIDKTLDFVHERFGTVFPLADLLFSNVHAALIERVESGQHLGRHGALGVPCEHLAFQQSGIDWQIWIEDGPNPVPRKIVITYKDFPGHPQYIAFLSEWDLAAAAPDDKFQFQPPPDAKCVEAVARQQPTGSATKKEEPGS